METLTSKMVKKPEMISCSFLHMLNQKKYQDAAEKKKNQLKVYYIRTSNQII